jgi:hypothetical protein
LCCNQRRNIPHHSHTVVVMELVVMELVVMELVVMELVVMEDDTDVQIDYQCIYTLECNKHFHPGYS